MNRPHLVAIACGHGLGHVRRVVAVIDCLRVRWPNLEVQLFAPLERLERLSGWRQWERVAAAHEVIAVDFDTKTNLERLLADDPVSTEWHERLPELDAAVVWSDNLLEILAVRPDAILSGSFLWHEVVAARGVQNRFTRAAVELLDRCRPVIVGNEYFATHEVRTLLGFRGVGLYRFHMQRGASEARDLLVAPGFDEGLRASVGQLLDDLVRSGHPAGFNQIFVDSALIPEGAPDWLAPATFEDGMFGSLAVGIVRPGMGLLSDLLLAGARVLAVRESGNCEMEHNAHTLERLNLGEDFGSDFGRALNRAAAIVRDPLARDRQLRNTGGLRDDGIEGTATAISEILSRSLEQPSL